MQLTTLVLGMLSVNTYLVGGDDTEDRVVIDPGEAEPVIAYLAEHHLRCTHIFITHGHFDHMGGAAELKAATGAKVYVHEDDASMLENGKSSLAEALGMEQRSVQPDVLLHDGDSIQAAGLTFRVLHTPGHSPGGVTFVVEKEHALFCGDVLFYEGAGRTDFAGGSYPALYQSITEKLYPLEGNYTVYSGHGTSTTLEHERACNPMTRMGGGYAW